MRYTVENEELVIRIPVDAVARNAMTHGGAVARVVNRAALAAALGRELIDCENASEEPHLAAALDAAMERVIEGADPSLEYSED